MSAMNDLSNALSDLHLLEGAPPRAATDNLRPDVLYFVANSMDIRSLQAWRASCVVADRTASYALNLRYNDALSSFFDDPVQFRNMLRLTSAVVSGSTALHILDIERADAWSPSDVDIYVPFHFTDRLLAYLCCTERYEITKTDRAAYSYHSYHHSGIARIVHLRREGFEIDIIQSATRSAIHPLPQFWSTHLMNYLTADSFCLAYPELTLAGKALLNPIQLLDYQLPLPRILDTMAKYVARGYDFRIMPLAWAADPRGACDGGPACPRTRRRFGDEHCLMGSFHSYADPSPHDRALPDAELTVAWLRGGVACGGECAYPPGCVNDEPVFVTVPSVIRLPLKSLYYPPPR